MYKDILSSSNKIKEIIQNRKKSKRFDYLNSFPLKKIIAKQLQKKEVINKQHENNQREKRR